MRGLALAALGAVAIAACDADRDDFISPVGDAILDFPISSDAAAAMPVASGGINAFALAGFDITVSDDAFGRATGALGLYNNRFGVFGFDVAAALRNSTQDPRLPALVASAAAPDGFLALFNPNFTGQGPGWWDLFGGVQGLAPNTDYTVALARMSLTVNGTLDAEEMLLTGAVTQPDELSFLGGAEAGDETVVCNFTAGVAVDAGLNPVALGTITTDAAGDATIDCLPVAVGASPWWRDDSSPNPAGAADSVPVGINATAADGGQVASGQYNYILLIEGVGAPGNEVPDVNPTVRVQLGPDIDAAGNVIPNAFAPFPAAGLSDAELLAAPGGFGQASEVFLTASNLAPLSGAYQVWLLNGETGDMMSPMGDVTITNIDADTTVIVSQSTGNTFNPTDGSDAVTFTTSDAVNGAPIGGFTHIFVSIESSGGATPSGAQPLWGQFTDMAGAPGDAIMWSFFDAFAVPFGTFDSADPLTGDGGHVFAIEGFGQGAFTGETFGTADLFRARFRNITLPPVGYYYEGFLRQFDGTGNVSRIVSTGDLTTEFGEGFASLREVDVDQSISTAIGPTRIIESANRATIEDVGTPFECFDDFILRLRPKLSSGTGGPTIMALGGIPEGLQARVVLPDPGPPPIVGTPC